MEKLDEAKWLASELDKYEEGVMDTVKQAVGNAVHGAVNNFKQSVGIQGRASQTAMNIANDKAANVNAAQDETALTNVANYITKILKKQNKQNIKQQKAANKAAAKAQ